MDGVCIWVLCFVSCVCRICLVGMIAVLRGFLLC